MTDNERERLTHAEIRAKSNSHRIDNLEERMNDTEKLITSVAIIAQKQNKMEKDVCEMKEDVKHLLAKPGQKWEKTAEKIIFAIVTAFVGFCLAKIGMA